MGTIFGFVSSDLQSKMEILSKLLKDDENNFKTTKSMIIYEKENRLLDKEGYVSGSRTLLRLHRGLDFIRLFLQYIHELQNHENTGHMCRVAYGKTLAKYHTFFIAQGAKLAMYTLPTKEDLLKRVCGEDVELINSAVEMLPETLAVMANVYNRVEQLYTEHNLHALP